jgi:hypothetical protein
MGKLHRFGCELLSLQVVDLSGIHSVGNGEKRAQLDVRRDGRCWTDAHYPQQGENRKRQGQRKEE